MKRVLALASQVSDTRSTILISGESGVGKNVLAGYIHRHSARQDAPMVEVNCAALPESLLEAELFGYEPGAFTNALRQGKRGLFDEAAGGTLFLEPVFTAEDAGWARDFFASQGKFSQEYFVYCKKI